MDLSDLGRALANARKIQQSTCEICGKPIEGIKKKKYCSNTCAQRAYYYRQKKNSSSKDAGSDQVGSQTNDSLSDTST